MYKNGTLEFFNHPEGIVEHEADGYKYVYQYKDHLGNIRLSYSDRDKDGKIDLEGVGEDLDNDNRVEEYEIIQEKNYYPFGMTHSGYNNTLRGRNHNYGYTGKEYSSELDLNTYDFGARNYDSVLGRWMNIDPLAEKYFSFSSYNYVLNSPIRSIDPDGMDVYILFYTQDNKDGDEAFMAAAETRKKNIEERDGFNSDEDIVLMIGISDISDIKGQVEGVVENYSEKYGQTAEVGIWSHGALDGPIGSESTSENDIGNNQMSIEGWGNINFNWKQDETSSCNFYGCNTANQEASLGMSFSRKVSRLDNFKDVNVSGQSTYSYPSFNPNVRSTNYARSTTNPYGFGTGDTYMVGGNLGRGAEAMWFTKSPYPTANPMNTFVNGKFKESGFKPNNK
ncbi:RHS repeat-associated core domain-containing protein [Aquimarina megaterium]|uniref:RHS repeat-associated core domain-containing protein n=1 Tax=Aquimarina megaterium TaxID=1443666 RepID=UPI000944C629|nr:RHS repeat-associated core domain-containing protein [Aquimarina megaterium]